MTISFKLAKSFRGDNKNDPMDSRIVGIRIWRENKNILTIHTIITQQINCEKYIFIFNFVLILLFTVIIS